MRKLAAAVALTAALTACTPAAMLELHRAKNPDGPYSAEVCRSPAETGVGRWDCSPRKVRQLRREARALVRAVARSHARGCRPGNPAGCEALIRSAAPRYGVSPGAAVSVGRCESGLNPRAYNPSSGASGIFQQLARYWPGRAAQYGYGGRSAFDPVANVNVSLAMVRDTGGWSHWSCRP